jgi:hypothetical protein
MKIVSLNMRGWGGGVGEDEDEEVGVGNSEGSF